MRRKAFCRPYYLLGRHSIEVSTLTPAKVAIAYQFATGTKPITPVKIGIGSLGGSFSETDVQDALVAWGLPAPHFEVFALNKAITTPDPGGANIENHLDIEVAGAVWGYCTGQPAHLIFCSGPNTDKGIADVTAALVQAGCKVISWSWGAPEPSWSAQARLYTENAFQEAVDAGVTICAASGDNSVDDGTDSPAVDYPCGSANVWAVGGTKLILGRYGGIQEELAWGDGEGNDPGSGGGFDPLTPKPPWQSMLPGDFRGCPDSSANADPASGYQILSDGNWITVGGTSAAAPLMAAYLAVCKAAAGTSRGNLGQLLYSFPDVFNDIVVGSNGEPAKAGWDDATGLGSPRGAALMALFADIPGPQPPIPSPVPIPPAPPSALFHLTFLRAFVRGEPVRFPLPVDLPAGTYGVIPSPSARTVSVEEAI